jgi:capsular exopolysaccharide synthesis family protein
MGRVDEAMKRAAALRLDGGTSVATESEAVAREPFSGDPADFPTEEAGVETAAGETVNVLREAALRPPPQRHGDAETRHDVTTESTSDEAADPVAQPIFEHLDPKLAGKIVVDQAMNPVFREQYRRLAASLHQAQIDRGLKVIIVVSAVAAEGKTLTASNLALTLSESYHRQVLLIDGDLRRPSLTTVLGLPAHAPGLSEGLFAGAEPKLSLHQLTPRLALLPAGRPMSDPMAGLTSQRMHRILAEARAAFDWVIVDTPPVGLLPDGHLLAAMGDGALLVVKASGPSHTVVQRAIESIGRERVLGVVLNKAEEAGGDDYGYRYDYRPHAHTAQ